MGITGMKEKVRDGYLNDLPETIQNKVFGVSKLIVDKLNELIDNEHYEDLTKSRWAMSCLDEFKMKPSLKGEIGSVRVYKAGKNFKCMIQVTGHFTNHQYGWIEELLHEIIADAHQEVKPEVRKKFDVTLVNEGEKGSPHEGFDIFLSNKLSKEVWDLFEDRKTKTIKESADESIMEGWISEIIHKDDKQMDINMDHLPDAVQNELISVHDRLKTAAMTSIGGKLKASVDGVPDQENFTYETLINELFGINFGNSRKIVTISRDGESYVGRAKILSGNLDYEGYSENNGINIADEVIRIIGNIFDTVGKQFNDEHGWMHISEDTVNIIIGDDSRDIPELYVTFDNEHSMRLWQYMINRNKYPWFESVSYELVEYYENYASDMSYDQYFSETSHGKLKFGYRKDSYSPVKFKHPSKKDIKKHPELYKKESSSNTPEYNVDMTETQAKRTLRTLSQGLINDIQNKPNYKVSQYTANIYANIITKNLLQAWGSGYKKLSITLDSYQSFFTFEFKIPTMSQDFISRFINGREPLNAFLHRVPEIKIKMSPRIFHTMKDPDDAFNFFKAAVKYYDQKVERYSKQLMSEAFKLHGSIKHLISTTNLSGIVTCPLQLLFVFDDVHMNNPKTFLLDDDDIKAVNSFMKTIYTKYAAPEKEKKKIVEDVKTLVKELRECCGMDDNICSLQYLPESVEQFFFGGYEKNLSVYNEKFISEQVDTFDMANPASSELKFIREKFGVKKLKKIPTDLVAYISIETDAIETPNDKLMIASYCLGKIEIVEWYIELLEVGSKKYVVPHSLPYLQRTRTQLLECYNNIMKVKVSSNTNRPIIQVDYPTGYQG